MILLKLLYLATAIEIVFTVFFILKRLIKNIGDKKITNRFNDKLVNEKKSLNKKIKNCIVVLIITILCLLIYGRYTILILDFMGDMMSPLWDKIAER